ncbi:tRNA (adenosine(37)-N6)-threonylcarbamoyltransferase complex ATPase subunit type 1 TsaE [Phytomonospora sp. NPDC050363]|uniref:tRNA (adenosine(37)-N6)-threonylcarbamoyltransferase complex ATPase subunit type 1 TsaE n=1 Tax=Phytomonospora sp. NPDC050363 TaxID=3155642 RepID=UPI0033C8CCDE
MTTGSSVRVEAARVDDTKAIGERLAKILRPGDLIVLIGPLGAGKTAFTQGLGAGLGVRGNVTSPTFVISRVHRGPLPLVHVDAYRLGGTLEVDDLDLDADVADSVTVVEWGEGLVEQLTDGHLEVRIERRPDDVRELTFTGVGADWSRRLEGFRAG